jgi:hypothetical protein
MTRTFIGLALGLAVIAAAPALAQDTKAADVLAKTRKALGDKKLDSLKTLSVQATTQRNVGSMQMASDVEIAMEMPDKYVRTEVGKGMMAMNMTSGFNGERPIMPAGASAMGPGGAMVIRIGPGGPMPNDGPKPTPEEQEKLNKAAVRAQRTEVSRLMLGWLGTTHPSLPAAYTYAGEAESPDGKAHVIDVKNADGFSARLFIDQNNFLPLMVTYQGRAPRMVTSAGPGGRTQGAAQVHTQPAQGQQTQARPLSDDERKRMAEDAEKQIQQQMEQAPTVEFTMFFEDWREVDGIQFPHVLRRGTGGEISEEWTISKVKFNQKLDAKKFAVDSK